MQSITIKGSKRESVGKKATKALRNADKVPCVLYGDGEPVHFYVDEASLKPIVYTPKIYMTNIDLNDGKLYETILHNLQFHPVTDKILHIDFYQLREGKELTLDVPIKIIGDAIGVKNGGAFMFTSRKISITSIPKNIPDYIKVNVENLNIGDSFSIADLENMDGLKTEEADDFVICRIAAPMADVVEDDEDDELGEGEEATEGDGGSSEEAEKEGDTAE